MKQTYCVLFTILFLNSFQAQQIPPSEFIQIDPFKHNAITEIDISEDIFSTSYSDLGTAEEKARKFLTNNIELFQMNADLKDLRVFKISKGLAGNYIRFYQTYHNIPVYLSGIVVSINKSDQVFSFTSNYRPDIELASINPTISEDLAILKAKNALNVTGNYRQNPTIKLMVLPLKSGYYLGYQVLIKCSEPRGMWEIFIDANDGQVLWINNMIKFATGITKIYRPDPLTKAEHYYGSDGYVNNNDADSDNLTAQREIKTLRNIVYSVPSETYYLKGPYVKIVNEDDTPDYDVVTSGNGQFYYTRSQPGFEQVMAYWHIDESQTWLRNLGFTGERVIQDSAIHVDAQGDDEGSYYDHNNNKIYLYYGDDIDHAEDADVIWHEYGHAIQFWQIGNQSFQGEMNALTEGFGDYWGNSYRSSISSWEENVHAPWKAGLLSNGSATFGTIRRLDSDLTYADYESVLEEYGMHFAGQIWSTTLKNIENELGRTVTNKIVIESHESLARNSTMEYAAYKIHRADEELYNGAHLATLIQEFEDMDFDAPPLPPTGLTITNYQGHPKLSWNANSESDLYRYKVYRKRDGEDGTFIYIAYVYEPTTTYTDNSVDVKGGAYPWVRYKIRAIDDANYYSGITDEVKIHGDWNPSKLLVRNPFPEKFALKGNFPNPFNPITTIKYDLPELSYVEIRVYDLMGREIRTLANGKNEEAGYKNMMWDGNDNFGNPVASGMYLYRLNAISYESKKKFHQTRKMVLLR